MNIRKKDKSKSMKSRPSKNASMDEDMAPTQSAKNNDEEDEDIFDMIDSGRIDQLLASTNSAPGSSSTTKSAKNGTHKQEESRTLDTSRFNSSSELEDDSNVTRKTKTIPAKKHSNSVKSQSKANSELVEKKQKKSEAASTPDTTTPTTGKKRKADKQSVESNDTDAKKKLSKSEKKKLRKEKAVVDPKKAKHEKSDQQRMDSFKKRQQEVQNQKKLIQQALANVDQESANKRRILFDSDSGENEDMDTTEKAAVTKAGKKKSGLQLFDGGDSDSDVDADAFQVRPEYEGKKGQKLMKMQQKQKVRDERFKLDQRFVESSASDEEDEVAVASEVQEEKQKSLEILKGIVGTKAVMASKPGKMFKDVNTLRYDPSKDDTPTSQPEETEKAKKKQKKKEEKEATELPEVSKDRFFKVEASLKDAFSKDSTSAGFSLLATYSSGAIEDSQQQGSNAAAASTFSWAQQAQKFSDESSSDDEEEEKEDDAQDQKESSEKKAPEKKASAEEVTEKSEEKGLGAATYFNMLVYTPDHPLIQETFKNFCRKEETSREEWKTKRMEYVDSFRTKRKRTLRRHRIDEKNKPQQKWHKKSTQFKKNR